MSKYSIQDFTIVSSDCDYQLFFSSDYQRVVENAINKLLAEYENNNPGFDYAECEKKLCLVCHKSCIEIYDRRLNPNIMLWDILEDYNGTIDREQFTLGYICQ